MSEVVQRDVDQVKEIANRMGLICFLPMHNELLIDLDIPYDSNRLAAIVPHGPIIKVLGDNGLHLTDRLITQSKSGRCHVYYKLSRDINDQERVALQAIFGSDVIREALCVVRLLAGSHAPIALFEMAKEAQQVYDWRESWKSKNRIHNPSSLLDDLETSDIPY